MSETDALHVGEATAYAHAMGVFVRAYRQEHGITLDAVAQLGHKFGAPWSLSSIQAIEAGRAAPTLPTLFTLALVLGKLSGTPIRLADLLGCGDTFNRPNLGGPSRPVLRSWVDRALSGAPVTTTDSDFAVVEASDADVHPNRERASLAEQRAAAKLGISPVELQQRAIKLWGHALESEAARRAGAYSSPQTRGRITRLLVHKLREHPGQP